ncbi:glycosyltransferase family 4 protein [Desulfovibrio ferrophilus]|uniref:Glycosyl transferase, group 1 n=1 Tax=Desulfovibrio ferrophilus TaxID=241368 RepID=A0A2Z6B233_9BACT|nr:glycosyltransferase family 4 protein [Desulfovibrio ferrophilus]BBD09579.1 glycosyl transferase, group 1 [Desulfovibrio ferrophilus]
MTQKGSSLRKLLIFKGAVVQQDDKSFLHRNVNAYLKGLATLFDSVLFCSKIMQVSEQSPRWQTELTQEVGLFPLLSPSRPNLLSKMSHFLSEIKQLRVLVRQEETCVLAHIPNSYVPLMVLLARPKHLVLYLASDWRENAGHALPGKSLGRTLRLLYYAWGANYCIRRAKAVICAGEKVYKQTSAKHPQVIRTAPMVDIETSNHATPYPETPKENPPRRFRFLYVGSFIPIKNLSLLARAFRSLVTGANIEAELHLVGAGPEEQTLRNILNTDKNCHYKFHGYISDKNKLNNIYSESDALVISSHNEGFPRVIYEAMRHGLPVVSTSVGGIPLQLQDHKTALLVPPDSEETFCCALKMLIEKPDLYKTLSQNGIEYVHNILTTPAWKQHGRLVNDILDDTGREDING